MAYTRFFLEEEKGGSDSQPSYRYHLLSSHGDEIACSVWQNHANSATKRRLSLLVEAANRYYAQEGLPAEDSRTHCLYCPEDRRDFLTTDGQGHVVCVIHGQEKGV